jgi:uncharacterized protein (TIGR00369 family)
MRARKDPIGPPTPAARLLGRKVIEATPGSGRAELEFKAVPAFLNRYGSVQGGVVAAMLDSAVGCALLTSMPDGHSGVTLEMKVTYIRPARRGLVRGTGRVVHKGRSVAFLEGELRDTRGNLLAAATATYRIGRSRRSR